MRLLVMTQAVDRSDQGLGFFHRWLEELAPRFESVEVVCLRTGDYALPKNVHVHALGPGSKLVRAMRALAFIVVLRHRYDVVLVHMNEEYVLVGGVLWRLLSKPVYLWRNHKMGSWRTRLAGRLARKVFYTSPGSYTAHFANAVRMPVGIDTDLFTPGGAPPSTVLFLGRLDPVKRVAEFIDAATAAGVPADIYGGPTLGNEAYAEAVVQRAKKLQGLAIYPGVPHIETAALYRAHGIYVNLTPSGSFDKTIGEAMASGCITICSNEALRGVLPSELIASDAPAVAAALRYALDLSPQDVAALRHRNRAYIETEHSLRLLVGKLARILEGNA